MLEKEGQTNLRPTKAETSQTNPLQEILDQHCRLSADWADLEDKASEINPKIEQLQNQLKEIRSQQSEIMKKISELFQP
ncbi:MAG: hypothetical protein AAB638_02805 [Patescibacteria group bacterium]